MINRWLAYLNEMFPLQRNIPVSFIAFFATYYFAESVIGETGFYFDYTLILGAISYGLFWLFLRALDELKDYEIDKKLFRDRPLITGLVTLRDIKVLATVIGLLLVAINLFLAKVHIVFFSIAFIYCLLMFKFFFYPRIAKSLTLAVITHNPIVPITQLYIMSFIFYRYGIDVFGFDLALMILLFWLPWLNWEISRKIRAPQEEDEYETYSQIFGFRWACFVVLFLSLTTLIILWYFVLIFDMNIVTGVLLTLTFGYFAARTIMFLLKPTLERSKMKESSELFLIGYYLSISIGLLVTYLPA
jgi:heme O synthase-like polyprenyltransferase